MICFRGGAPALCVAQTLWRPLPSAVVRREAPLAGKAGGAAEGSGTHKVIAVVGA